MIKRKVYWITDGIYSSDPYRVITNTDKEIDCNHCFKNKPNGFIGLGKFNTYQICKSCLYNPSIGMTSNNFICVKESNNLDSFNYFLKRCDNKTDYDNIKKVITI